LSDALVVILAPKKHKTIRENPNKALIVYPVNNKKAGKRAQSATVPYLFPYNPLILYTVNGYDAIT
jgi:hypothetical protein